MLFWEIPFVIFLLIASIGYAAGTIYRADYPVPRWAAVLAVAFMLILWFREEMRWQLYPAYLLVVALVAISFIARNYLRLSPRSWIIHIAFAKTLALIAIVCAFLAWALPIVSLPELSGPHKVGTASFHFVDNARKEVYGDDPTANREIMVQVWYPAEPEDGAVPQSWFPDLPALAPIIMRTLAQGGAAPAFLLGHLDMVKSNSYPNAPIAGDHDHFPVVIYSHGWTGFRKIASSECENLASHGYVVAAADHAYGAMGTVYPDGRIALLNPKAMPPREPADERQAGIELLVDTFAGDVRLVIDRLHQMNAGDIDSPLAGRLGLNRLGLFGHSTGGGAITEVYLTDPRVRAAVGLDPWLEPVSPDMRNIRVNKPYLSLRSEGWVQTRGENAKILNDMLSNFGDHAYDWYVKGSEHADFTLLPLLSPLVGILGQTGTIEAERVLEVVDETLVAFFDEYLIHGSDKDFENPSSKFPELIVTPEGQ